MGEAKPTPGPCPFCGHVGLDFAEGSTFRWIVASCGGCGASLAETRIQTLGDGTRDEWMEEAKADAIAAWNRRSDPLVERVKELEKAAKLVLDWYEAENDHSKTDFYQRMQMCRDSEDALRAALSKARPNTAEGEAHSDNVLEDATRWHEVLNHVGADNLLGGAQYVLRGIQAPVNVMQGSVAQHFTKSIDAARKQAAAKEPSP